MAPAGVTLYTVGILKTLPGIRKYVAIDGGMSDNIRTALYHADYEPTIANKAGQPREEIVTLCGKHCESGDAVVIDMPLQKADLGDIVCVFGTGGLQHDHGPATTTDSPARPWCSCATAHRAWSLAARPTRTSTSATCRAPASCRFYCGGLAEP